MDKQVVLPGGSKSLDLSWAGWPKPVIPAVGRHKWEDSSEFKARLVYTANSSYVRIKWRDPVPKNGKEQGMVTRAL